MPSTVVEMYYKNDELGDPLINASHIKAMGLATEEQVKQIEEYALKINSILTDYLKEKKIELIDFKLEFGLHHGEVILGDEISPGFPAASTNPPSAPALGPISINQSAARMISSSCSTTIRVFPR